MRGVSFIFIERKMLQSSFCRNCRLETNRTNHQQPQSPSQVSVNGKGGDFYFIFILFLFFFCFFFFFLRIVLTFFLFFIILFFLSFGRTKLLVLVKLVSGFLMCALLCFFSQKFFIFF